MKKILVVSTASSIKKGAGAIRIKNILTELVESGRDVDFITRNLNELECLEIKNNNKIGIHSIRIPKIIDRIKYIKILFVILNIYENNKKYDLVILSAPDYEFIIPFIFKYKYILDMRDLWTQDKRKKINTIDKYIESKLLSKAEQIINTTKYATIYYEKYARKITTLYNARKALKIVHEKYKDHLNYDKLLYIGTVYDSQQKLLEAVLNKFTCAEIQVVGSLSKKFEKKIAFNNNLTLLTKRVSYNDSIRIMNEPKLLVLLIEYDYIIPAKTFDYLNSLNPILAIGHSDDCEVNQILEKNKKGKYFPIERFKTMTSDKILEEIRSNFIRQYDIEDTYTYKQFKNELLKLVDKYEKN